LSDEDLKENIYKFFSFLKDKNCGQFQQCGKSFAGLVLREKNSIDKDELEELKLATWMHDVGKIATPEYVVDKKTKLETIYDRIHTVETRFNLIMKIFETDSLHEKLRLMQSGKNDEKSLLEIDNNLEANLREMREDMAFILQMNSPQEFDSQFGTHYHIFIISGTVK